ncbi:hypothetical protein [Pararhizobium antarcticum]|uniref:Uncharacterized protein n=1 Tax=Pararhizobium antarcticum TaxID=1798805 RepID=A0A657LV39_9HYPH|nr:hypothetical protein [Pararhizobium antarcticum]OJF97245.1 hypothetical protein AX761_15150 [Rhizobium sp. 58]OJF99084.1 hypothetical protein AX760_13995 [Pararhizobium antarcticum]
MHYSVQIFTWSPKLGVHQVGSSIEIDAVSPKFAATTLLGMRLEETGSSRNLAVRVWKAADADRADCHCYYYH